MQDNLEIKFRETLHDMVGQKCWGFAAGKGTGSVVDLHFGNKIARKKPSKNCHLSEDMQKYDGEIALFIECAWRIDFGNSVVCGAWEDNSDGSSMLLGLQSIIGQKVESIQIISPVWDLAIYFTNGKLLRIFCTQTDLMDEEDSYSLFSPKGIYIVGTRSKLQQEFTIA